MSSKPGERARAKAAPEAAPLSEWALVCLLFAAVSSAAVLFFYSQGYLLYYGDAAAHLNIARRIFDGRTPGYEQIGTVWLPVPHLLMLPLVGNDALWRNGLAGAIPSAACFLVAGLFLYGAARLVFESRAAAIGAAAIFALNPNVLYLQSIPMSESAFFASFAGLLYFSVRFRARHSLGAAAGAGLAALAGSLTRYDGWFLIPFAGLFFLIAARKRGLAPFLVYSSLACLGPLYWLAHNWWVYGDVLEFYHGPYSAKAIYQRALDQGMARYPGDHEWGKALLYYRETVGLCAGWPLVWLGVAGFAAALVRRIFWPVALLALPAVFYVLSMYSSGTPIFVPHLWPQSYYNTRYGLVMVPGLAFAAAALIRMAPVRFRPWAAAAGVALAVSPWLVSPNMDRWVCWKESQMNSIGRRAWTKEAAQYLKAHHRPGQGVITSFGDLTDIFRQAGIPIRETLHEGDILPWYAAVNRPDLFLREEWAVTFSGEKIATAIQRARRTGPSYDCVLRIARKGAPVVEVYRRIGGTPPGPSDHLSTQ